jgi:hypothetical protein
MSTTAYRSLTARLPHTPETGRQVAKVHGVSEFTNDVETIVPTVSSWDQHFALLSSTSDGTLHLRLVQSPEEVHAFYIDRVNTRLLLKTYGENDVAASWYKLTDTRGEWRSVATGEVELNRAGVLFPAWTDGIIGEIMWDEPAWAGTTFDTAQRMDLSRRLETYENAWRSGDADARVSTVEDTTCSVIRVVDVDEDRRSRIIANSLDDLRAAWDPTSAGRVIDLQRLSRIATNSYVFASYRLTVELDGRTLDRETAVILPLGPNNKFVGELSYSMEVEV